MISRIFQASLVSLVVFVSVGCDRLKMADVSTVSISLPSRLSEKSGAQNVAPLLKHVVISVTGPGLSPVSQIWDCHDNCTELQGPFQLKDDVSNGKDRLIQILAAYEPPGNNGGMVLKYGDKTVELTGGSSGNVDIPVKEFNNGSGQPVINGRVAGRYLKAAQNGPTDAIQIRYNPGAGKPSLLIEREMMVNGWFNVMMMTGADFEYVLEMSGEKLWGGPMNLQAAAMMPSAANGNENRLVRAEIPLHISREDRGAGTVYENRAPQIMVWGYWGEAPALADKRVCLDASLPSAGTRTREYRGENPGATDQVEAPGLLINRSSVFATNLSQLLTYVPGAVQGMTVGGGAVFANGSCDGLPEASAGNLFARFQKIAPWQFDGASNDSFAGFRGIFTLNSMQNAFTLNPSANAVQLAGQALPGVPELFNQVQAFKLVSANQPSMDQADCTNPAANGYVPAGTGTIDSAGAVSVAMNITAADRTTGVSALLCPARDGRMAPVGVRIHRDWFQSGNGGSMPSGPPATFGVWSPFNTWATGQCHRVQVNLQDASMNWAVLSAPQMFTLDATGLANPSYLTFYSDPSCGTAIGDATVPRSIQFPASRPDLVFWVKSTGYISSGSLAVSTASAALTHSVSYGFTGPNPYSPTGLRLMFPALSLMAPGSCMENEIYLTSSNGGPANASGAFPVYFNNVPANVQVLSDCAAGASITALTIPSGDYRARFAIKAVGAVPAANSQIEIATTYPTQLITVNPLSNLGGFTAALTAPSLMPGLCQAVIVTRTDMGGVPVGSGEGRLMARIDASNAMGIDVIPEFSMSPSCSGLSTWLNVEFPAGMASVTVYAQVNGLTMFVPAGTAGLRVSATSANGMPLTIETATMNVVPALIDMRKTDPTNYPNFQYGVCVPFEMHGLTPGNSQEVYEMQSMPFVMRIAPNKVKIFNSMGDCGGNVNAIVPSPDPDMVHDRISILPGGTRYLRCEISGEAIPNSYFMGSFSPFAGTVAPDIYCAP